MPFYLTQWNYEEKEIRAMLKRPQNREEAVRTAVEAFGGLLKEFFFSYGEYDGLVITEFPDDRTAKACLMAIKGTGGLSSMKSTVLTTSEEASAAMETANAMVTGYATPSRMSDTGVLAQLKLDSD